VFDFLSSIGDFLGSVASAIGQAIAYLFALVVQVFEVLVTLLGYVVQFFGAVLSKVGSFLHHVWEVGFRGILTSIWQHIRDAVQWVHDHLGPIIDRIKHIRDRLDRWYRAYVVPYLNSIQRIRGYLHILALLHIKLAAELDARLAQEQARIVQAFATVRAAVNAAIDIGNAIVDPAYLIRKPALLLSIRRQIPALIHAVTGRPPGYWFPSPRGAGPDTSPRPARPFSSPAASGSWRLARSSAATKA
jgi:hypothetical protein